ncbi:MAG TPA: hypothetical protein VK202_03420, partial [Bacteroidia bacterium]|nr:hypothetical protein [Bacteroidia bacterium]
PVIAIYNMSTSSFVGKKNQNKQAWKNFFNNPDQIIPYENDLIILNMNHSYELIGKMTISD